jgi:cation-transporting ATPase 13A2
MQGAPEKIRELCTPSTVPLDYLEQLSQYTQRGFRVIAMAGKPLPGLTWQDVCRLAYLLTYSLTCLLTYLLIHFVLTYQHTQALSIARNEIEVDLQFLGFLILQNKVKPATPPVIKELRYVCMYICMYVCMYVCM